MIKGQLKNHIYKLLKCILGALPTHYPHVSINHRMGRGRGVVEKKSVLPTYPSPVSLWGEGFRDFRALTFSLAL